jgi:peptidase M48-like protein
VAFALAHEIGHHDLGHLNRAESWAAGAVEHTPLQFAVLLLYQLQRWIYSRDMEFAADEYALELCRKAGFDVRHCRECFDILSRYMLDHHDIDGVYGSDAELELNPQLASNTIDRLSIEARLWLARHRRSHPAIQERRHALWQKSRPGRQSVVQRRLRHGCNAAHAGFAVAIDLVSSMPGSKSRYSGARPAKRARLIPALTNSSICEGTR